MLINNIKIGERFRKDIGDIDLLAKSIKEIGLLHPIVINENNELIAGVRRLEACKKLGWADTPVTIINLEDIKRGEYDENAYRKHFLPSEMVAIAKALKPEADREAEERIKEGRKEGGKTAGRSRKKDDSSRESFTRAKKEKRARDEIGEYVGVSGRTLEKAEEIMEAAEKEPEKYQSIVEKMDKEKRWMELIASSKR
jgi:Predicted transcriptional regulators